MPDIDREYAAIMCADPYVDVMDALLTRRRLRGAGYDVEVHDPPEVDEDGAAKVATVRDPASKEEIGTIRLTNMDDTRPGDPGS